MPRPPSSYPQPSSPCDPRLPEAALAFRRSHALTTPAALNAINVTAWLYCDARGDWQIQVNPNVPIRDLVRQHGPAETRDAEVGFHSEMLAAEWFRQRPALRVQQIFSERIPCPKMCAPMLRHYFAGVPWYYYYDPRSWLDASGRVTKRAGDLLPTAYGL